MSNPSNFDLSSIGTSITSALTTDNFWAALTAVVAAGLTVMVAFWGIPKVIRLFKRTAK